MGVREELRAATADIHEALHGLAPFARIAEGTMDRAGYGALLQMLHRYHRAMSPLCNAGAVALAAPDLSDAHQARIAALQADIEFLALRPAAPAAVALAPDGHFAMGCLYTVQGSTLGGKVIARQLDGLLPDGRGRSFFQGAAGDSRHWRDLCDGLERHGDALPRISEGAAFAFSRFGELVT